MKNGSQRTTLTSAECSLSSVTGILTTKASTCTGQRQSTVLSIDPQIMGVSGTVNLEDAGLTPVAGISACKRNVGIIQEVDTPRAVSRASDEGNLMFSVQGAGVSYAIIKRLRDQCWKIFEPQFSMRTERCEVCASN